MYYVIGLFILAMYMKFTIAKHRNPKCPSGLKSTTYMNQLYQLQKCREV
jgi:hypothetical protein